MSLDTLYDGFEEARLSWDSVFNLLVLGKYDREGQRAAIGGQSTEALHRRAIVVFEGFLSIRPADNKSSEAAIIEASETGLLGALKEFIANAKALDATLRTHWKENVLLRDKNNNFLFQFTQADGTIVAESDLSGSFLQLHSQLNALTTNLALLLPLCRPYATSDLSKRAIALGDLVREVDSVRNQSKKLAGDVETSAANVAEKEKAAQAILTQAEAILAKLEALQTQGTAEASNVKTLVEMIKTTGANAETLEQTISGYQS